MKGELHPSNNSPWDGLRRLVTNLLLMDNSANELYFVFLYDSIYGDGYYYLCECLMSALLYSHCVMRCFPLGGVKVLHPAQYDLLDDHCGDHKEKKSVYWLSSSHSD